NNAGQVVGSNAVTGQAILWQGGSTQNLAPNGIAWGINQAGAVVGQWADPGGTGHAFVWINGIRTDLGTLGGNSAAFDINESGQIVGASTGKAALWDNGSVVNLTLAVDPTDPFFGTSFIV